mmetsp:Transcript_10554/g.31667  ORF Transcript_10554/g.31667 Transcript_10554/m.31667 type:complete len:192 (-) Transcript_10554:95-670(-)
MPTEAERTNILQALCVGLDLDVDINLESIAVRCDGYSGADLKGVVGAAQLEAAHDVLQPMSKGVDLAIDDESMAGAAAQAPIFAVCGDEHGEVVSPAPSNIDMARLIRLDRGPRCSVSTHADHLKRGDGEFRTTGGGGRGPTLNRNHFEAALQTVRRSVTEDELAHYHHIHSEISGAGCTAAVAGSRSTLA